MQCMQSKKLRYKDLMLYHFHFNYEKSDEENYGKNIIYILVDEFDFEFH